MKRTVIVLLICPALVISLYSFSSKKKESSIAIVYTCLPCGSGCDSMTYDKPGTCSHCNMRLVDRSTIVHKNIEPDKMCSLDEKNVVFLDVRTTAEFNGTAPDKFGAIKNAINIPVQELETRIKELEKYKDKEIIVYCSHSHRSPRASYMLTQNGFKHVTNMLGGMSVWKEQVKKNECNERLYQQQ
jgi:rhodanese-related sulfurtransferase/DNA-directed RNA polymerase subunit RPC12/RpoP